MKNTVFSFLLLFAPFLGQSQDIVPYAKPCPKINAHGKITMPDGKILAIENDSDTEGAVFFIVRHAEKDTAGGSNADLIPIGRGRAEALKKMLKKVKIKGVYSTNVPRTIHTAEPIAKAKHQTVALYDAKKQADLLRGLVEKKGKFFIVGHSNTINQLVNTLTGKTDEKDLPDSDYSRLYIVSVKKMGDASVLLIRF